MLCANQQALRIIDIGNNQGKFCERRLPFVGIIVGYIKKEVTDESKLEDLEDAMALQNISNMPARVKCAVLAWHTLKEALKK